MSLVTYRIEDRVGYITLNRPEKLNAITVAMRADLFKAFEDVRRNPDVWIAVVNGAGGNFSVGHDLTEMHGAADAGPPIDDLYLFQLNTYKPIVAAIAGYCLAQGAGIALCSDIRLAATSARFGWPQVKRGIASISGPALLAHIAPRNLALEALLLGDHFDAANALRLNIVNRVVADDQLEAETAAVVAKLRANAPLAMRAIKETMLRGMSMSVAERVRFGALMLNEINHTADAKEGLAAFAEKRAPVWTGT